KTGVGTASASGSRFCTKTTLETGRLDLVDGHADSSPSVHATRRRKNVDVTDYTLHAGFSEAVHAVRPQIDVRRLAGNELSNEAARRRAGYDAEVPVTEGIVDIRILRGRPDDRQVVGRRRPLPHPFGERLGTQLREHAFGMCVQDAQAARIGRPVESGEFRGTC